MAAVQKLRTYLSRLILMDQNPLEAHFPKSRFSFCAQFVHSKSKRRNLVFFVSFEAAKKEQIFTAFAAYDKKSINTRGKTIANFDFFRPFPQNFVHNRGVHHEWDLGNILRYFVGKWSRANSGAVRNEQQLAWPWQKKQTVALLGYIVFLRTEMNVAAA